LKWGDVDAAGLRLRLPRSATKRDKPRWVYLPEWLMRVIEETCPLEDRVPERRVFQGITEASLYQAWGRGTIWHHSGVVARDLADRLGHSDPWMSLNVYAHVLPVDEAPPRRLETLLTASRPNE
jgi:integrase